MPTCHTASSLPKQTIALYCLFRAWMAEQFQAMLQYVPLPYGNRDGWHWDLGSGGGGADDAR